VGDLILHINLGIPKDVQNEYAVVITKLLRKDIDLFFEVQMETPSRNSELQSPNWSFSPFAPCSPFSTKLICLLSEMPY
jgi:hypothetical protein